MEPTHTVQLCIGDLRAYSRLDEKSGEGGIEIFA